MITRTNNKASKLLLNPLPCDWYFPSTRYRGSKRKILPWIYKNIIGINFDNALDLFGGSAMVSLLLKRMGKQVYINDYLNFNYLTGIALIQNNHIQFNLNDLDYVLNHHLPKKNHSFISTTFRGYYFLDIENKWLDRIIGNIYSLENIYSGDILKIKKAIAFWALGQSCLRKRPFNLFHRKNLYLRTNDAVRSFGNKTTWDVPFTKSFRIFIEEANATIFDNTRRNYSFCENAFTFNHGHHDLVYLDPPYFFENQRDTDYRELYHFLDGMTQYYEWSKLIDYDTRNLRFKRNGVNWPSNSEIQLLALYRKMITKYRKSIIVISHKSQSLVTLGIISNILKQNGKKVKMHCKPYKYALSKSNGMPRKNIEWLIIGE